MVAKEGKLLKDYDLDYIREQYNEKHESLEEHGREVNAWAFYEDVFGSLDIVSPAIDKKHNKCGISDLDLILFHMVHLHRLTAC